jgi:UDP-N-acetylglucosamine 4,6-dehydratase
MKNFLLCEPDLDGKVILVTGGTGTFGHGFVKKVLENYRPKKLIIFSRDEQKQFHMAQLFSEKEYPCMRYFIGDVRDAERLDFALREVDIVVHAAAMKHVHIAEYNPSECIQTNLIGAENIVKATLKNNVKKVIALSTDKAVSPVNLYGATKLAAEKTFVAANNIAGSSGAQFAAVRYGNVLGSRGSVVPFFRKLIADGAKKMPITHEKMTRFWITIPQAVDFVLSNLALMQGGEIFIPKIPSMRMVDLALALAPELPIEIIGLRPGEKLHECMITSDESYNVHELVDRYVIPSYDDKIWKNTEVESKRINERFSYVSHLNDEWLTDKQFLELINE